MYYTILFDLDGTLTDSREGILNSVRYALEKLRAPIPDEATLLQFIGPPLPDSFRRYCGFDEQTSRRAVELFRERYRPIGIYENAAAPGMAILMGRLCEKGYTLAIASSKPQSMCIQVCERFGFTPYLRAIVGSPPEEDWDKARVIREALRRLGLTAADLPSVLMVGDRRYDVEGARLCGIDCAGVEFFGYAEPGELKAAGAVAVFRTPAELEVFLIPAYPKSAEHI